MSKSVLFWVIQICISMQFSSFWPIDRIQSGATTPKPNGPEINGNEGVLHIPQASSITEISILDFLES